MTTQVERREPKAGSEVVRVRFVIAEGVQSVVESVDFSGNAAVDTETLRKRSTSASGQPYFEPQISEDADSIALIYLNRGYPEASVQPAPKGIGGRFQGRADVRDSRRASRSSSTTCSSSGTSARPATRFSARCSSRAGNRCRRSRRTRRARTSDLARSVPPRRHFLPPAARRAEPSRRHHHGRRGAGDDHRLRRRCRRWKAPRALVRRRRGGRGISGGAARVLPDQPPQPVREGPIDQPLHARQLPAKGRQ